MNRFNFYRLHTVHSTLLAVAVGWGAAVAPAHAARIKDVAAVQGVRTNQLTGYGLVVGLDGKGDKAGGPASQSLRNYLQQMGLSLGSNVKDGKAIDSNISGANIKSDNVAAVLVTAQLPPFARPGQAIDVTVSSIGDAKSLRGGTLISTPLRGVDGQIYALAQGNLLVGGAGGSSKDGKSSVQVNHLNAGRIPDGAQVERAVPTPFLQGDFIELGVKSADFQTARRVAAAINQSKGGGTAQALDGRVVRVRAPQNPDARVAFLADLEELNLDLPTPEARVVVNSRTGSIVMNQAVTLGACAVAHGNLTISVDSTPVISQPNSFTGNNNDTNIGINANNNQNTAIVANAANSGGVRTVESEKANITITQDGGRLMHLPPAPQLSDVVRALNSMGVTPQDLVAILQAIKSAGALNAELEVI